MTAGSRLEFATNLTLADDDVTEWARRREDQGWDVLSITDHIATDYRPPFPHLWVAAGAVAAVTSRCRIQSTFVNTVFRHPVDTAQAARQLQAVSGGRFELGVGAGWYRAEMEAVGVPWPSPGKRVDAWIEALHVLRPLLAGNGCRFDGAHFRVDVGPVGPTGVAAPPLIGSVGGPRTIREVTPLLDRVEVKPAARATRGGALDWDMLATISEPEVRGLLDAVRAVRPDIAIDLFVLFNAVDDAATRDRAAALGGGFQATFFGPPAAVEESIQRLGGMGVSRVQLSATDPSSFDRLAPLLF
ncbi:MAG: LLM class flavin-dependent oxidoreductase [Acidimicrobiia bacterium]|nr:LLM class flavin-dependent oxidoreductase [Acidimicrobiia bacterium]